MLPLAEQGKPSKIIENGAWASFSPDGRYVVYESKESGRLEVYVVPFGDRKGKWQVSPNTGSLPSWSSDGKQLYYVEQANGAYSIVAVPVKEQGDQLQLGSPQMLIGNLNPATTFPGYNVSPDGKRILVTRLSQQGNQSVTLVTNFAEGLKK